MDHKFNTLESSKYHVRSVRGENLRRETKSFYQPFFLELSDHGYDWVPLGDWPTMYGYVSEQEAWEIIDQLLTGYLSKDKLPDMVFAVGHD